MTTGIKIKGISFVKTGGLNLQASKDSTLQLQQSNSTSTPKLALVSPVQPILKLGQAADSIKLQLANTAKMRTLAFNGLGGFRPEIIMGTRFEPAYAGDTGRRLTPTGEMLQLQMTARNVRLDNINAFIELLRDDDVLNELLNTLQEQYTENILQAEADTRFLIDAFMNIDGVLRIFDIYNNAPALRRAISRTLDDDAEIYDLQDIFVDQLGFSSTGYRRFTNTKLFTQLAFDLGNAVRRYTPGLFDIVDEDRPNDIDPYLIDRTVTLSNGKFSFDIATLGSIDDVTNAFEFSQFNNVVAALPDSRVDKMKLLATSISRVLSISSALATTSVQADLQRLGISDSVEDVIGEMIGVPGQSIMDEPSSESSLIAITQIIDDDNNGKPALPFERRYIIDASGRSYTPGSDYFFDALISNEQKFDVTRLVDYEREFERRVKYTMNVIEAATRTDTPQARKIYGKSLEDLHASTIYKDALEMVHDQLTTASGSGDRASNFLFILAIIDLAQDSRKLRHLLFQLLALSVIYNDVKELDGRRIEIVRLIRENEVRTYGDFPALTGYAAEILDTFLEVPNEVDIGAEPTAASSSAVIEAAYRQVQRLVLDTVFELLTSSTNKASIKSLAQQQTNTQSAKTLAKSFNPQLVTLSPNSVGVDGISVDVERPDFDQTFDEDFRVVMLTIASFIDSLEDEAGRIPSGAKIRRTAHLLSNKSGKSRHLQLSSSMRLLLGFELAMTALGAFDISKFSGVDTSGETATLVYSKSRIATLRKATTVSFLPLPQVFSLGTVQAQFIPEDKNTSINKQLQQPVVEPLLTLQAGQVNDRLYRLFQSEFLSTRDALDEDLNVIRSMALNFRSMYEQLDNAVGHARAFFDDSENSLTNRNKGLTPGRPTRARNVISGEFRRTQQEREEADLREKRARKSMMSRMQTALATIKMNDITEYNTRFGPENVTNKDVEIDEDRPQCPFVDDSRVTRNVQGALWSMLAEPTLRGDDGGTTKVLTVGVPAGLNDKLEDSDLLRELDRYDSRTNRQLDMITVDIHRKDVVEDDIIFKPKQYLFEMSRFVSSFSFENLAVADPATPLSFESILRDKVRMLDVSALSLESLTGQLGVEFYNDERYEFLSDNLRRELVRNHVVSYLMSVYIRMLTGMDMREDTFLVEGEAVYTQDDAVTADVFRRMATRIIENSGLDLTVDEVREQFPEFDKLLTSIEEGELQPGILEKSQIYDRLRVSFGDVLVSDDLTDLAKLGSSRSMLSGGEKMRRAVTSPRIFERIFHVPVDPYDFEIDVDETNSTAAGRFALRRLRLAEKVVETVDPRTNREVLKLRRVPPNQDITVDQYFTVISRYRRPNAAQSTLQASNSVRTFTQGELIQAKYTSTVETNNTATKQLLLNTGDE